MRFLSLKDFYNSDKMNRKLRERIDLFEPELPESLWDRIEHTLDKQANSRKRAGFLVYSLVAMLLVAVVGIGYLVSQNYSRKQQLVDTTRLLKGPNEEITIRLPETAGIAQPVLPAGSAFTEAIVSQNTLHNNNNNAVSPAVAPQPVQVNMNTPLFITNYQPVFLEWQAGTNTFRSPQFGFEAVGPVENDPAITYEKETAPIVKVVPGTTATGGKFFMGISSGMSNGKSVLQAANASRFNFEHAAWNPQYQVQVGYTFRKYFYVSTGAYFTKTGENVRYGLYEDYNVSPIPTPNPTVFVTGDKDSLRHRNTQNWVEIPLEFGVIYPLGTRFSFTSRAGMTYAFQNGFSGKETNPAFTNGFDPAGTYNKKPFVNNFNASVQAGVGYNITPRWMLNLSGTYRRAVTSVTAKEAVNYPARYPQSFGGQFGITYFFK